MNRLILAYLVVLCAGSSYGMTREQVKKTMAIVKNQCMPKNSVTEEQVGRIEQGVFIEDRNVKNDKLDMALITKQIDLLYPPELKEPVKKSVAACLHSQDNYNDLCERVFYGSKCLYEKDPNSFIFP
ncbi:hypothetical protein HF086_010670 [Spodoptera exigua]|uniref:Uncharacterized protein n=1 Tax=Spodoptera exigua TaxID=7107 RepID=A0A922SH30_SPOEX|nr:hypothetical protein HF086_010670 [Spodoptera exigua]